MNEADTAALLNENDSVSIRELVEHRRAQGGAETGAPAFGDNDGLSARVAIGVDADLLVLLTDVDGVRDAEGRRLDTLTVAEAERLIDSGVIAGGMVPKIRAALAALAWDGAEAVIADASADRALERALNDPTFGTRLTASRKAVGAA